MKATYHAGVHRFAVFTVCWTVFLLIAGALVTSNDAALSVPDWPKSFGTWTPPMVGGVFYEHSHRVIAGTLGVLTLILAILIWIKEERRWLRWFAVIAVGGIVAQAILGGQVVIQLLHYWLPVDARVLRADHVWRDSEHCRFHKQMVDLGPSTT